MFGPPRHQVLKDRLARLLQLRDPGDRSLGVKTLHIGMVEDTDNSPERFFCASEQMAVVPIPSLTSHEAFDSGVVFGPAAAARLVDHGRQAYAAARRIETIAQIRDLRVVREGERRHDRGGRSSHRHVADRWRGSRDVVKLTRELVQVPSRGGIDSYDPVLEVMAAWLSEHGLACRQLTAADGATVALTCEVPGGRPGPRYVLDACLDTAPFGDETAWPYPPASGEITGGWMHGRGSSDSKAGAAIFAHVAARLRDRRPAASPAAWCCYSTSTSTPEDSAARKPTSKGRARPAW